MKRIIVSLILGFGFVAQAQELLPPCEQALALSSRALVSLNFAVEQSAAIAAGYWSDCRLQQTRDLLADVPSDDLLALREAVDEVADAWLELSFAVYRTGTRFVINRALQQPDSEDLTFRLAELRLSGQEALSTTILELNIEFLEERLERQANYLRNLSPERIEAELGFDPEAFPPRYDDARTRLLDAYDSVLARLADHGDMVRFEVLSYLVELNDAEQQFLELPALTLSGD